LEIEKKTEQKTFKIVYVRLPLSESFMSLIRGVNFTQGIQIIRIKFPELTMSEVANLRREIVED
jgi:hypothetical protein